MLVANRLDLPEDKENQGTRPRPRPRPAIAGCSLSEHGNYFRGVPSAAARLQGSAPLPRILKVYLAALAEFSYSFTIQWSLKAELESGFHVGAAAEGAFPGWRVGAGLGQSLQEAWPCAPPAGGLPAPASQNKPFT